MALGILAFCWCASVAVSLLLVRLIFGTARPLRRSAGARVVNRATVPELPPSIVEEPPSMPLTEMQPALSGS
jgi:hypothetical protein